MCYVIFQYLYLRMQKYKQYLQVNFSFSIFNMGSFKLLRMIFQNEYLFPIT